MGELVDLQGTRAGQFGFNDWIGQQDQAATPKGVIPAILPVQEMREFQRRYRFDSALQAIAIGERWTVTWIVPRDEWWRPLALQWRNGDTASHTISFGAAIDRRGAIETLIMSSITVGAGRLALIYGVDGEDVGANDYHARFPFVLQPGDIIIAADSTVAVAAGNPQYTMVYELVPRPAQANTRGLAGTVAVT